MITAKLPSAVVRGVSPVIVKTPPAVTSSSLPRGIVTATVPPVAQSSVPQRTSSPEQKLTSVAVVSDCSVSLLETMPHGHDGLYQVIECSTVVTTSDNKSM